MPLNANLIRCTFNFSLAGGVDSGGDIAQPSLWFWASSGPPSDWQPALETFSQGAYDAWAPSFVASNFPSSLRLDSVRTSQYDAALKVQHIGEYVPSSKWLGIGASSLPWQLTNCIGLYSYVPGSYTANNRQKRGRFFMPPYSTGVLASGGRGNMDTTFVNAQLDAFNGFAGQVQDTAVFGPGDDDPPAGPLVVSRVAETIYNVTHLTSDIVLDTQRRRTNSESRTRQVRVFGA